MPNTRPDVGVPRAASLDTRELRAIHAARECLEWLAGDAPVPLWLSTGTARAIADQLRAVEATGAHGEHFTPTDAERTALGEAGDA